ncbi:MAG: DUF2027 domain-containing protein [Salinivirgaceae bacterium]|nr:DUF2027 domain-containing protein [Salinivirgaceae bacterium]
MEVSVGDKVRFLNDVGGGIVTKVLDRRTVMIMNEFDFEVPAAINDLIIVEEAAYTASTSKNNNNSQAQSSVDTELVIDTNDIFYPEVAIVDESGNDINVSIAFVPQARPGNSDMNVYLINDSNYNVLYSVINREDNGKTYSNSVGVLEANVKEQIETLSMNFINQLPEYIFHLAFYRKGDFTVVDPVSKNIRVNPVKFYKEKAYTENDFFNENAILIPIVSDSKLANEVASLSETDLNKIIREKEKVEIKPKSISKKEIENKLVEVDLHIHELLDDFRGLSNGEIMEIQLDHFKGKLEDAIKNRVKKIVFIHGVGNGTLKLEIRNELDRMKNKLSYQDASFQEYGYGATMVQIK